MKYYKRTSPSVYVNLSQSSVNCTDMWLEKCANMWLEKCVRKYNMRKISHLFSVFLEWVAWILIHEAIKLCTRSFKLSGPVVWLVNKSVPSMACVQIFHAATLPKHCLWIGWRDETAGRSRRPSFFSMNSLSCGGRNVTSFTMRSKSEDSSELARQEPSSILEYIAK